MTVQAHMELRAAARATVPNDAYANLLKASWILTDVIVVHPHMIYIEASVQCDVLRLTEVSLDLQWHRQATCLTQSLRLCPYPKP